MEEPTRHRALDARMVAGLRAAGPAQRISTALGLTELTLELAAAGRAARARPHG